MRVRRIIVEIQEHPSDADGTDNVTEETQQLLDGWITDILNGAYIGVKEIKYVGIAERK